MRRHLTVALLAATTLFPACGSEARRSVEPDARPRAAEPPQAGVAVAEGATPESAAQGGAQPDVPSSHRIQFGAMGTDVVIEVIDPDAKLAKRTALAARAELERVEDLMTSWRDSPLTRMNAAADGTPQPVPHELAALVERALTVARLSGGAFEPTFLGAGRLWDFKADPPRIPTDAELEEALAVVDWHAVNVDLENDTIAMPAGTQIGLGGIAKGYGVDRAMQVLVDAGVEGGIVNAGGDLKALGLKGDKPWEIAIKHPRERDRAIALVPVTNVALVTSGDYERFFELDGVRYHHILDPRNGRPATGCMSATVSAPDAALADALATAVCVLGPDLGLELIERLPRVEALAVGLDGEVHASSGLARATR